MNKKALILSLPMILAVFLLGGWFLFREQKVSEESPKPPVVGENPTQNLGNIDPSMNVDTSSWKTYRNEAYGFELKYPEDIYEVEDGGYISLISFVARNKDLKEKYGDIQVLYGNGEGGSFDEKEISKALRIVNFGGKKVYFDESQKSCGAGVGYCPIPGEAFIFSRDKSYSIRRITFQEAKFPLAMEENFVQFLINFKIL